MTLPAQNLDAEAAVLSAVLLAPTSIDVVRDVMSPRDCYSDANRRILEVAFELDAEGTPVDAVTVAARLRDRDRLAQIGGTPYIVQLCDKTPAVSNVTDHARIVRDLARVRNMVATCQRFAAEGYADVGAVDDWLQSVERAVFDAAKRSEVDLPEMLSELVPKAIADVAARSYGTTSPRGVRTGLSALDNKIHWLRYGMQYVLAGRPGMGKSACAGALCVNIPQVNPGTCTVYVSAEMPKDQITLRLLAAESRIPLTRLEESEKLRPDEWKTLAGAAEKLSRVPMSIQFAPGATIADIRSIVRRELRRLQDVHGDHLKLAAVFVDYLQILNGQRARGDSRENEIADISKRLLWLAGEFDCAMIALSQLNRDVERRGKDKRPQLSDLRESGAIEQDAFAVLFTYRDEYYNKNSEHQGIMEIKIAKQRQGPLGTCFVRFSGELTAIDNISEDDYAYLEDMNDAFEDVNV